MIRIKRPRAGPIALRGAKSKGGLEAAEAIAFYSRKANRNQAFDFSAYSLDEVKEAVGQLFRRKCAYCESPYAATQPVDVEHFRPKGAIYVAGKIRKPGYYWLAAAWKNLLPSCIDCNRERTHAYVEGKRKEGKANHFPLAGRQQHAKRPGEEKRERPLLLDPTRDDPDRHLEFAEDGSVEPKRDARGHPDPRGLESITRYALLRPFLKQQRRAHAIEVLAQIERVHEAVENQQRYPADSAFRTRLEREIAVLKAKLRPDQRYVALTRALVRRHLRVPL